MKRSNLKRMAVLGSVLILALLLSGCIAVMTHARFPASITKGSAASGPNQWFARVALADEVAAGQQFHWVVWLKVPTDWTLPWASQFSFTGHFQNTTLSQNAAAQTWIESASNCQPVGGPAGTGYKWRAFMGPFETMPASGSARFNDRVNLRGGLGVPGSETSDVYQVAMVVGVYYDSDSSGSADLFNCNGGANTLIDVP